MNQLTEPDPRWSRVWASITTKEDRPETLILNIELFYAGQIWFARTNLEKFDPNLEYEIADCLNEMVHYIDHAIEEESGMNQALQLELIPENYRVLRFNGMSTKAIEALAKQDSYNRTKTIIVVIDPVDALPPTNRYSFRDAEVHDLTAALARQVRTQNLDIQYIKQLVEALTHPRVIEKTKALLKTIQE